MGRSLRSGMHLTTLRRVGLVLMLVGAADIALMIYTVAHGRSYSSSLNIFALVAGILVYRGRLGATRVVAHAAAFMFAALVGVIVFLPLVVPSDLVVISARLYPESWALTVLFTVAGLAALAWIRGQLTTGSVAAAFERSGGQVPRTTIALATGAVLSLVAVLAVRAAIGGESAQRAMGRAREQVGGDYRFLVTNMTLSYGREGKRGQALVLAYRPGEMRPVLVSFGSPAPERTANRDVATPAPAGVTFDASSGAPAAIGAMPADDVGGYVRRATVYARAGEYEKALADVDAAIRLDPDGIEAHVLADWILARQNRWDEIIERWTRFIETHPASGRAFLERAGTYHHKGDDSAARRDLEQACALQYPSACQLLQRLTPTSRP